jgi:predicted metal-binding protein
MDTIAICRTCPRDTPQSGTFGLELRAAIRSKLADNGISIMMVQCLGSCRRPCAVAFDAPYKARVRFSDLAVQDSGLLIQAALQYAQFNAVSPSHEAFPKVLQSRISAIAPKHVLAER